MTAYVLRNCQLLSSVLRLSGKWKTKKIKNKNQGIILFCLLLSLERKDDDDDDETRWELQATCHASPALVAASVRPSCCYCRRLFFFFFFFYLREHVVCCSFASLSHVSSCQCHVDLAEAENGPTSRNINSSTTGTKGIGKATLLLCCRERNENKPSRRGLKN